jgi:hypothetical protein
MSKRRKIQLGILLLLALDLYLVFPILTTVPSERARRVWEKDYASMLPPGYTDFRAHRQSQDVGVRLFSFRCPEKMSGEQVLTYLTQHMAGFQTVEQTATGVALRRPATYSDQRGFDEFRFVYRPGSYRVFGFYANLDSELDVHGELVKELEQLARSAR